MVEPSNSSQVHHSSQLVVFLPSQDRTELVEFRGPPPYRKMRQLVRCLAVLSSCDVEELSFVRSDPVSLGSFMSCVSHFLNRLLSMLSWALSSWIFIIL